MPRAPLLLFLLLGLLFICVLFSLSALSQDAATGAIHGTVLDPSGSRVAQSSIVAVNSATGTRYSATSDAEGRFSMDLLPPGDYTARAVSQGMSPQVTPTLHVDVGAALEIEFHLSIAGAQEKVTVSGAAQVVDTKSTAVSTLLDERAIADLPLNGRRFSDLMLLSPGVTQDPRSLTSGSNGAVSVGGIRGFQNSFLVDGSDYNNGFFAQALGRYRAPYQFSTEVVQEFRVPSNGYGAEQGRAGGAVINVVTKSGSNHVHGTAFYDIRDSSLAASDAFVDDGIAPVEPAGGWPCSGIDPDAGGLDPHNRQQQMGGTIGGPIKRNKIFFFAGYDQHIFHNANVVEFLNGTAQLMPLAGTGPYTPGDFDSTDQQLVCGSAQQLNSLAGEYPAAQIGFSSY